MKDSSLKGSSAGGFSQMKAMVLEAFHQPLQLKKIQIPGIGPEEALVHVLYSGVCGTEIKII